MKDSVKKHWPLLALGAALAAVVFFNVRPYHFNLSANFHMDEVLQRDHPLPPNFVVLRVPSYDGAQYYQVARNIPKIANPARWPELASKAPGSYAYQRFLLPLTAFLLSFGQEPLLPYAFLLINIGALILTAFLLLKHRVHPLFIFALCLSPAAMVAMHFTLAEPLTILLIILVLLRYKNLGRFDWKDAVLLSLLVLAREVNTLFIGFLAGYSLLKMRWKDAAWMLVPAGAFLALHGLIYQVFGNIPFLISAEAKQLPGSAAVKLLLGGRGYNSLTLSSIALFLGVVIPGIVWTARDLLRSRAPEILPLGTLAFFGVMLLMPDYIWGSITSIGRVITPVYPLYILSLAQRNGLPERLLAAIVLAVGIAAAIGLALSVHPYSIA